MRSRTIGANGLSAIALLTTIAMAARADGPAPPPPRHGCLVWTLGPDGAPLRPDADRSGRRLAPPDSNQLSFTFVSPEQPWTSEERDSLQYYLSDFIPAVRRIYGAPAFSNTVNIVKDTTLIDHGVAGTYSPYQNVLTLWSPEPYVLCHELVHAFHDDDAIFIDGFEEGMARAMEIKILDELPGYRHWDSHHAISNDVYYEALNQPEIRPGNGYFWSGSPTVSLRYSMSGYLWDKVEREHPGFLKAFNESYYALVERDSDAQGSTSKLVDLAGQIAPTMEGTSFSVWASQQQVLGAASRFGVQLYQFVNSGLISVFFRHTDGFEEPIADASVEWEAFDGDGVLADAGTARTDTQGFAIVSPIFPWNAEGRVTIVARARTPLGDGESRADRTVKYTPGLFGVVLGEDQGSVTITPLDSALAPVVAPVVQGQFGAPSLQNVAGRFSISFAGADGRGGGRMLTKDSSSYLAFVRVAESGLLREKSAVLTARPSATRAGCRFLLDQAVTAPAYLTLYDPSGRILRVLSVPAGSRGIYWNGADRTGFLCSSGVVLARLTAPGIVAATRVVALR